MEKAIERIRHELEFQRAQAKEYEAGQYKDDLIFTRYDQAAKMLEWVLKVLEEVK